MRHMPRGDLPVTPCPPTHDAQGPARHMFTDISLLGAGWRKDCVPDPDLCKTNRDDSRAAIVPSGHAESLRERVAR